MLSITMPHTWCLQVMEIVAMHDDPCEAAQVPPMPSASMPFPKTPACDLRLEGP